MDFKKKIDTCASSPHINAKLHDVPAQHENLRQAQYHANLDYDAAPKWIAIGSDECRSSKVVFERPHLHNKTEITFPNFGLLQKRQRFQLKGENQFHLTQWSSRKASPATTVAANPEQPTPTYKGKTEKTFVNHKP